jgi:DNA-binding transcriptional regulator YhcF (GntR family)
MSTKPPDKPVEPSSARFDDLAIDRDAEVPIGVQLAWALRSRIGDGQLAAGERLPGLRDVAEAVGVNVNTVRAVYQRLELEGLIASHQGSGTFVTAMQRRSSAVGTIAASAAREALETGVDPREVAAALYVSAETTSEDVDDEAERRRLLRVQIAALERALGEIEASHPGLAPPSGPIRAGIGPSLPSADELEQVRTLLVRRLASVQEAIDTAAADRSAAQRGQHAAKPTRVRSEGTSSASVATAPRPRSTSRPATAGT